MPAQTLFTSPFHIEKLGLRMGEVVAAASSAGRKWAYKVSTGCGCAVTGLPGCGCMVCMQWEWMA
jgi:hypothetical protein